MSKPPIPQGHNGDESFQVVNCAGAFNQAQNNPEKIHRN